MSEKKLFPGVSEQDIIAREQAKLAEQKRQEAENQAQQKRKAEAELAEKRKKERMRMYQRYMTSSKINPIPSSTTFKEIAKMSAVMAVTTFVLGNMWYLWWGVDSYDDAGNYNEFKTPYKEALRDAYWPVADGKFNPTYGWGANMLIAALVFSYGVGKIKEDKRTNRNIAAERSAIDTMAYLRELPENVKIYKLNKNQIENLTSVAKSIISEMSADCRVYFDMIIDGKIDAENQKDMLNLATMIMTGHLSSHPEDINKVLAVFNERSIPEHILSKYKQHIK